MIAPVIDMPTNISSAPGQYRRPEYVINTPYHKTNENSRFQYRFVDGFYESTKSTFTNPLVELRRNDAMRHAQQLIERWGKAVKTFEDFNRNLIVEVSTKLIVVILNQGFTKVTFEKTPDDSLLMTGEWNGKIVYIDLFFDEDEPHGYEAILNVYEQKRPVLPAAGSLSDVFTKLFGELSTQWNDFLNTPFTDRTQPA